jgi:DUF3014 family protein
MKNTSWWLVVILILGGAGAGYYYWQRSQEPPPRPPARTETPPAPKASAEPQILHPLPETPPEQPLPALSESDQAMRAALAGLISQTSLSQFFHLNDIIRRFVVTVDNLPRRKVAQRLMSVNPVPGRFLVTGEGETGYISPENPSRYTPAVRLAEGVDARKLVAVYVHFYPLFQQQYAELGYPSGYFNDRLIEVMDHLLAAPDVQGPVKLVRPKVLYEFADPNLESLSAGQKILVRMGGENSARVKAKLREIRGELTSQAPKH